MRVLRICFLNCAFILSLIFSAVECSVGKLKCYQCEVRDANLCTDEYLQTCPDNQAYDSCMTRVYKTKDDGPWIQKSCALAPCTLRDLSQSTGLGLDFCDRSQNEFDCTTCCKENGCNVGGAYHHHPFSMLIAAVLFFSILRGQFSFE